MEGSDDHSVPKPHADECKNPSEQHNELGLGFESSLSVNPDPTLGPLPSPAPLDDPDQNSTSEVRQNQQQFQIEQPIADELQDQQSVSEKLLNDEVVNEELRNLVLEAREKVSENVADREESLQGAENETNDKGRDHEVEIEGEEGNKSRDAGDEEGLDGGDGNLSENEKEDEDRDHEVETEGEDRNQNKDAKGEVDFDDNGSENEKEDKDRDHEAEIEGDDRNENDYARGEEGFNDGEDNQTENEKEDDDWNANVGESLREGEYKRNHYPVRPDADDCSYFMRTGLCKFGSHCKFNHPLGRKNQAAKENMKEKEDHSERTGQTECKYYLMPGGCKYGKACRYNHNRGKPPVAPILELNFLGLPIRPGEKECPFYMRNGSCKYGSNCRFNHPNPTAVGSSDTPSGYGNGGSVSLRSESKLTMSSWSSPRALNETVPFVPMMFPLGQEVPSPIPEWKGYQAPVYVAPQRRLPTPPAFTINNLAETNIYMNNKQPMLVDEFPERPGQPECSYFLKTGDCKYRSGCKFHHPKNRMMKIAGLALSDKGLPLRPDQNICSHYNRYGICKFGPACKFDHPVSYDDSVSSAVSSPFGIPATVGGTEI